MEPEHLQDKHRRAIQHYFDGELTRWGMRRMRRKIASDPALRRELEALERICHTVRESANTQTDTADFSQLWQRVQQGIRAEDAATAQAPQPSLRMRWGLSWVAGLGAAAAVLLAVLWVGVGHGPRTRNDCVIEKLDVGSGATSSIFTIGDKDDDDSTTVIWVDEDDDAPTADQPEES